MKEYIERAAALDICQKEYEERLRMADYCGDTVAWNIGGVIKSIPAADVAPVRHGYWIDLNAENSTGPLFKCSECSHLHNPNRNDLDLERVELKPLYCDACGARMDKEDEHDKHSSNPV